MSFGWCSARRRVSLMTMKAENNVLGQGLTLLALYNIVQCRLLLHKLVRVNYSSNVFLFLVAEAKIFIVGWLKEIARVILVFFLIIIILIKIMFYRILTFFKLVGQSMFTILNLRRVFTINIIILLLRSESILTSLSIFVFDICENKNFVIIQLTFMLKTR